jgi:hypothetical protein
MILLVQLFGGTVLFSIGFVVGCFWSTNFVRDRMERNATINDAGGAAEPFLGGSKDPEFSFAVGKRTSVR